MPYPQRYCLTGLRIASEFPLLHVEGPDRHPSGPIDVTIREGRRSEMGDGWIQHLISLNTVQSDIRCQPMPELRIRITGGNRILVHRSAPVSDIELSIYLTGLAWGLLCHQRDLLPLHCSAIAHDGAAFAFTGPSGAGKSTLLQGLTRRGFVRCCDDIMVTSPGDPARVHDMASGTNLWDDAVAHFGEDSVQDLRVRSERRKYHLPIAHGKGERTRVLGALYVLESNEGEPRISRLSGYQAWSELYRSIYRIDMVPWINSPAGLARKIDAVARSVPVFRFFRPRDFTRFEEGLDVLESHFDTLAHARAARADGVAELERINAAGA